MPRFSPTFTRICLTGLFLHGASTAAHADAHTFTGTLGTSSIVVELTDPADGPVLGRYAWLDRGVDIALSPVTLSPETTSLSDSDREGHVLTLDAAIGPRDMHGTWQPIGSDRSLPVTLWYLGSRPFVADALEPYESFTRLPEGQVDAENAPYENIKARTSYLGGTLYSSGGTYNLVSDPRTFFVFPRVLTFLDGKSTDAINDYLLREHQRISLEALDCLAKTGNLGGFDEQLVEVVNLSSRLMSITRSAMITCGGPSITAYTDYLNIDVETGTPLPLDRIFKDWSEDAPRDLADFVRDRVEPDFWLDGECDPGADLNRHLAVTFVPPMAVHFYLDNWERHCDGHMAVVPLDELQPFFAEGAMAYLAE